MDKYRNFSIEDFLQDEFFHKWIKDPFSKEAELWENWLEANPEMRGVVEESRNIIHAFDDQPGQLHDDFYLNLKNRIDNTIRDKQRYSFFIPGWLKVAVVFTGLIVIAGILFYSHNDNAFTSYKSKYAEIKKVLLPDGSEVVLNANSFLKYRYNTSNECREIWLQGEAFFSIKHIEDNNQQASKLIVHARDVNVEVIGTQFNINANDGDKTKVLLTKGKVSLSSPDPINQRVDMKPGELVIYNEKTKGLDVSKVAAENYIAWLDHKYIFEKITLEDLSKEIQGYYGKSVIIRNLKMRKQLLSGTLELQDEETLIKTLSALLGVPVDRNDNDIIIGS